MSQATLFQVETRKRSGSSGSGQLRREGLIPAVIYGRGVENQNIKINEKQFSQLLHASAAEHILVNLAIDGSAPTLALVQDVQHNYLTDRIVHVDFHAVNANEKIHASLPVVCFGEALGVGKGGLFQQLLHSVEVFCLPKDLPETIIVDITNIDIDHTLSIKDIVLPEGVEIHLDGDIGVAQVYTSKTADA